MTLTDIAWQFLKTGLALGAATTVVILAASQVENKAPWAAINCVAHIVDGDDKEQPADFAPRESALGLGINTVAMLTWAGLYEGALAVFDMRSTPAKAALVTLAAAVIDYKIVPKQYTPGIEKRLSPVSVGVSYLAFAAVLACSPLWKRAE